MTFTPAELHRLNYAVQLALARTPADSPAARYLPDLLTRVEQELATALRRTETPSNGGQLEGDERIGTEAAAKILGCTRRWVQQRIRSGDLEADIISGTYVLRKKDLTE